uniref:Uncharacterized protein n=1 Tax=Rhizophora mucronata TaxID=61149 RepID=A0A2P2QS55_RHIMU
MLQVYLSFFYVGSNLISYSNEATNVVSLIGCASFSTVNFGSSSICLTTLNICSSV